MKETRHKRKSTVLFHLYDVQGQTKAICDHTIHSKACLWGREGLTRKQQGITFWKVKIFFVLIIDQALDYMNTYNYKKKKLWGMLCP